MHRAAGRHALAPFVAGLAALGVLLAAAGCARPKAELDLSPFIDVWTSAEPAKTGAPAEYLILQGNFSVCQVTVRGAGDADYAGGDFRIADNVLTINLHLRDHVIKTTTYAVTSVKRGALRLTETAPDSRPLALVHAKAYTSCADVQNRFGNLLKIL